MTIDFTGSDPQIRGFKNSSLANTHSAAYLAVSSFFDADIPRNEGTYRRIDVIAPEGTIVNARPPRPHDDEHRVRGPRDRARGVEGTG